MYSQLVIAALAASAAASANLFPGHMAIRRDLLVARQTDSASTPSATSGGGLSDDECQATLLSIATALPMPNDDLLSWEQEQTATDPCAITSVPSSIASDYTSYSDAVLSWYSESSSELYAALSACPQYAGAVSEVDVCTSGVSADTTGSASATGSGSGASATGSSTGTATQSGSSTGSATGSASSSAQTAGAAVREVGIVGAVLAGVLGVAVAL